MPLKYSEYPSFELTDDLYMGLLACETLTVCTGVFLFL